MAPTTFDGVLTVRGSSSVPPRGKGDPHLNVYHAVLEDNGSKIEICIAHPAKELYHYMPFQRGTRIHACGDFNIVGTTFFVTACSVRPVDDTDAPAPDPAVDPSLLAYNTCSSSWPIVVFGGWVSSLPSAPASRPGLRVLSVALRRPGQWPRERVHLECTFDCTTPHLAKMPALAPDEYVVISGVLTGVAGEKLTVDVHDVRYDEDSMPCTAQRLTRDHSVLRGLPVDTCNWFADIMSSDRYVL